MSYELSLHLFTHAVLGEFVDSLAGAALDEVACKSFKYLMRLHPNISLTVLQYLQEHDLKVVIRD